MRATTSARANYIIYKGITHSSILQQRIMQFRIEFHKLRNIVILGHICKIQQRQTPHAFAFINLLQYIDLKCWLCRLWRVSGRCLWQVGQSQSNGDDSSWTHCLNSSRNREWVWSKFSTKILRRLLQLIIIIPLFHCLYFIAMMFHCLFLSVDFHFIYFFY